MAQGGRQDRRRHRVAARLLRLPGRALDPPQDDEPDRVHVLDGQAAHEGHQGPRLTSRRPGDGVQADRVRRTTLAGSQRTAPRRPRPRRSTLREGEDHRTRTARSRRRRVINEESDPQVLTIPRYPFAAMAKAITTTVTDDLDGNANAKLITFGLDGVAYSIDASSRN